MIRPKSQNFKIGHDGILSIENFILMIKNHILLFQLPGNWPTTKKCAPNFRGNMEFPIYFLLLLNYHRYWCHFWFDWLIFNSYHFKNTYANFNNSPIQLLMSWEVQWSLSMQDLFISIWVLNVRVVQNSRKYFWNDKN
jgi:hypothetical protein